MDYLSLFTEMLMARGLADNTIRNYQTYLRPYLAYLQELGISPDAASWQVMRDYLRYIKENRSLSHRTVNMIISHLQFFQIYVLHKQWDSTQVPFRRFRSYLPCVPSRELVRSFPTGILSRLVRAQRNGSLPSGAPLPPPWTSNGFRNASSVRGRNSALTAGLPHTLSDTLSPHTVMRTALTFCP